MALIAYNYILNGLEFQLLMNEIAIIKSVFFLEILVMTYAIIFRLNERKEASINTQTEMQLFLNRQEIMSKYAIAKKTEEVYLENLIMLYDLDGFEIKLLQYISEGKDNKKNRK